MGKVNLHKKFTNYYRQGIEFSEKSGRIASVLKKSTDKEEEIIMKKFRAVIASVFTALTLICVSAMNTFAVTLGKSTVVNPDSINNNTVQTGDNSQTIIFIVAGVAVVALAVIIISIIASKKKK